MADEILVKYITDVSGLKTGMQEVRAELVQTGEAEKKFQKEIDDGSKARKKAIEEERQDLAYLKAQRDKTNDPTQIREWDKAIKESEKNLKALGDTTEGIAGKAKGVFSVLRQVANIIPGIGISGLVLAGFTVLSDLVVDIFTGTKESVKSMEDFNKVMEGQLKTIDSLRNSWDSYFVDFQVNSGALTKTEGEVSKLRLDAAKKIKDSDEELKKGRQTIIDDLKKDTDSYTITTDKKFALAKIAADKIVLAEKNAATEKLEIENNLNLQIANLRITSAQEDEKKSKEHIEKLKKENDAENKRFLAEMERRLKALKDLDIKYDAEKLKQLQQTDSERLSEQERIALLEVTTAKEAAITSGTSRADAELIAQNAITNIKQSYADKQADLADKQRIAQEAKEAKHAEELTKILDDLNKKMIAGQREVVDRQLTEEQRRVKKIKDGYIDELDNLNKLLDAKKIDESDFIKFEQAAWDKRNADLLDSDKKRAAQEKAIDKGVLDFFKAGVSALQTIQNNRYEQQISDSESASEASIAQLDNELKTKSISQAQYDQKKEAIQAKQRADEKRLKTEQFEANKQASIINAIIATAEGVVGALAQTEQLGYAAFVLAALVAAGGAVQVAAIESQPTPKFAKGVVGLKGKGTRTSDSIDAKLSVNESVIIPEATDKYRGLLEAMNKKNADKYINDYYIAPVLKRQIKKMNEHKEKSFANNLASSMMFNFKDENLLDSLRQSRKNDRDNTLYLAKIIEKNNERSSRSW